LAPSVATAQLAPQLIVSGPAELARPHDLVLDPAGRWLYVADMNNDSVAVLDPDSLALAGRIGVGELAKPHDVAFGPDGRLLVADTANSRIAVYELSGTTGLLVAEITAGLNWTEGVAAAPGGDLYASNVGGSDVARFRAGRLIRKNGASGNAPGQLIRPHDIDVAADGRLFIADPGNHRIQIWNADLQPITELRHAFNEPKYFDLAADGWLYVADQHNNVIKVFDAGLERVVEFGEGILNLPEGVEVAGQRIWIADTYNDRVRLFRWVRRP
jgi:YVTN family beta-propeller protein